ncbi:MAG: C-terminal binding protein [Verrucomicrobia bacterium]|nr:C-terminal binding protein [Verrucomicrobiota bacterium]
MKLNLGNFKAALVAWDAPEVPQWVVQELEKENIELITHECTTREELAHYAGDADVVWVFGGSRVISAESLSDLKRCGAILRSGSGTDNIPVEVATRLGILVANTPEATCDTVSDHAIALLLSVIRQIPAQDRAIRNGIWDPKHAWPGWNLSGSTLGLVGFGHIAQHLARKVSGFEISLMACDPFVNEQKMNEFKARKGTLQEVLSRSDFVSIHVPLTKETHHLIGERELRWMRPKAVLINTSRGAVIDEKALVRALNEGRIGAAGLDVFETEPLSTDHPLTKLPNVVLTPHSAGDSPRMLDDFWRYSVETVIDLSKRRWPSSYVNRGVKPRWRLTTTESVLGPACRAFLKEARP